MLSSSSYNVWGSPSPSCWPPMQKAKCFLCCFSSGSSQKTSLLLGFGKKLYSRIIMGRQIARVCPAGKESAFMETLQHLSGGAGMTDHRDSWTDSHTWTTKTCPKSRSEQSERALGQVSPQQMKRTHYAIVAIVTSYALHSSQTIIAYMAHLTHGRTTLVYPRPHSYLPALTIQSGDCSNGHI